MQIITANSLADGRVVFQTAFGIAMPEPFLEPGPIARDRDGRIYIANAHEQGGVREYWLIDPIRKQAEFYVLGADGIYRPAPTGGDGIYESAVLKGLKLKVEWLWQEPLPTLLSVLKEWKLV